MNYLQYKLLTKKKLTGEKLPPALDSLLFHLQQANCQCYAYKSTWTPILKLPGPVGNR